MGDGRCLRHGHGRCARRRCCFTLWSCPLDKNACFDADKSTVPYLTSTVFSLIGHWPAHVFDQLSWLRPAICRQTSVATQYSVYLYNTKSIFLAATTLHLPAPIPYVYLQYFATALSPALPIACVACRLRRLSPAGIAGIADIARRKACK